MKLTPLVTLAVVATMALAHPAHAQETTAAGTLSHEASWSALQTLINQTKGDLKIVQTDVEAIKTCGRDNKIWNPDKGCISVDKGIWVSKPLSQGCSMTNHSDKDAKAKYVKCAKTPTVMSKCEDKGLTCYVDTTCTYRTTGGTGAGGGNNGHVYSRPWASVFYCQY